MTITYTWIFTGFDVAPAENGLTDVVKTIHWRYRGTDEQDNFVDTYGSVSLPSSSPENFVPFDQITRQWAIDAVSEIVDTVAIEELHARKWQDILANMELLQNPSIISKFPPLID